MILTRKFVSCVSASVTSSVSQQADYPTVLVLYMHQVRDLVPFLIWMDDDSLGDLGD